MLNLLSRNFSTISLLLIISALFSSCAKLPISTSEQLKSNSKQQYENIETLNYNKSNNINYGVANSESYLFVKAIFHEEESLIKIMRGGLYFYFDANGKKGKDYNLKIERGEKEAIDRSAMQQRNTGNRNTEGRDMRMQNMPKMLNSALSKVTWDANGKELVFYRGLEKYDIEFEITTTPTNEAQLLLKMPLTELPISDTNLLSIGIASGTVSNSSSDRPNGGMRSSGGMGGGRGGGGGGGMGGGPSGGGGGRGGHTGGQPSTNTSPFQIWFQVDL